MNIKRIINYEWPHTCLNCPSVPSLMCSGSHHFCNTCANSRSFICDKCSPETDVTEYNDDYIEGLDFTCKSCKTAVKYLDLEKHFDQCLEREIPCENCGFLKIRSDMPRHLSVECNIKWNEKCPFGCDTFGYSSKQLLKHRKKKYLFHLDILYSTLTYMGLDQHFLLNDQSRGSFGFYEFLKNDETTDISEFQSVIKEINDLITKIRLKRFEKKEQMRLLEKSIDVTLLTSYNGVLVWMFAEEEREKTLLQSSIFYTGKYGYKLQLLVLKSENDQKLYLDFLEGTYDPILREWFETSLKIEVNVIGRKNDTFDEKMKLDRTKGKILVKTLLSGVIEWIKFEIDCSNLEFSSLD